MKLANIFSDNTVFQAEKPMRFFGEGSGVVVISFNNQSYEKSVEDKWVIELPAQPYGGPVDITVSLNGDKKVLKNIAFGDVYLCAGQSNMQFMIDEEVDTTPFNDDEKIRYFVTDRIEKYEGLKSVDGWKVCKVSEVGTWSALGLHMAQRIREKKDVYIGLVGCFQGASAIQSWMPERKLDSSVYVPIEERHKDVTDSVYSQWNGNSDLYKHTFLPIAPFSFNSVIWYQGESNTSAAEGKVYTQLLSKMIDAWREDLLSEALPFVVIEICDFDMRDDDEWRAIQACQQEIQNVKANVKTVTSKDVCESWQIHPGNKEKLAKKVADVL